MGQKKLVRFAALKTYPHVFEKPEGMKGKWQDVFEKKQPLTLELACGKGEYAVGLGLMQPERNFIGVDIKGNRIYIGAKKVQEQQLKNIAFLRIQIDSIAEYFNPGDVQEIWLTFPDPQLRTGKLRKRLTHPVFLRKYQQFLVPGGSIHLKTDSPVLYLFTKKVIELFGCSLVKDYHDVYVQAVEPELKLIKTHYESLDIAASGKIYYLQFVLPASLPNNKDELLKLDAFENETGRGN